MIRINPLLAASAVAAFALQLALPAHAQKTAAANYNELLRSVEQNRAEDNKKFDDRKKEFDGLPEAQKNAKMKEAHRQSRCARQGLEKAPRPVLRERGQDQSAERSAAGQSNGARSHRALRSRPAGVERRVDDPPAIADHDAVPAGSGPAIARRVPARVLLLAHDADGGGAAEGVDRDSARDDRERPSREISGDRRAAGRPAPEDGRHPRRPVHRNFGRQVPVVSADAANVRGSAAPVAVAVHVDRRPLLVGDERLCRSGRRFRARRANRPVRRAADLR